MFKRGEITMLTSIIVICILLYCVVKFDLNFLESCGLGALAGVATRLIIAILNNLF